MLLRALTSGMLDVPPHTVQVKIHPRARGLTLRYSQKLGHFTLTRPKRISAAFIREFLQQNRNWMDRQIAVTPQSTTLQPGDTLAIQGIERLLVHRDAAGVAVTLTENELIIACRRERFARSLLRWMKHYAEQVMNPLVYEKAEQINKPVHAITYRDTQSRWGSCSHDGKLSFSWRLIMARMEVIDYLVAHEVAHLQEHNHSARFWKLCRELTPHTTFARHWLKTNGAALHRIQFIA